ncbi:22763_t:CDS:2, partial [Gigaspora margarita]
MCKLLLDEESTDGSDSDKTKLRVTTSPSSSSFKPKTKEIRPKEAILNDHQSSVNITSTEMINSSHSNESNNASVSDISVNASVQICRPTPNSDDTSGQIENSANIYQDMVSQCPTSHNHPEINHVNTPTKGESSTTSLPQDIIDDDSAETLDFVEMKHKERVSEEIMERIREKKLREQNLSSDNNSPEPSNLSYKDQILKSSTISQSISSHSVTTSGDSSDLLEQLPIKQKNKTPEIDIKPLIQELNIKPLKEDTIKIVNVDASEKRSSISSHCVTAFGKNSTDNQSPTIKLVYLFERICFAEFNTMRAKQDEIASCRFTENCDTNPPLREKNSCTHMTEPSNSTKPQISNSSDSEAEVSMSNTPDSPISRKLDINVTSSTKNKTRPSISTLPGDPEEKRKHIIKIVLDRFPYLSLKYSNEYGDYLTCLRLDDLGLDDLGLDDLGLDGTGLGGAGLGDVGLLE